MLLDGCVGMAILRRMKNLFSWVALSVLAFTCNSCAVAQLAQRTAGNMVKGVSQTVSSLNSM